MRHRPINPGWIPIILIAILLAGCVSTEEAGGGKAGGPQPTTTPVDTAEIRKQAETMNVEPVEKTLPPDPPKKPTRKPSFESRSDTVTASVVHRSKSTRRVAPKIVRPENPAYTVQIGAFAKASNALLLQRIAKERFSGYPVFNNFNPADNLYRVSIGKFDRREEAMALRREMIKLFPKDYSECWVNYIVR